MNGQDMATRCAFRFGDSSHEVIDETEWLEYLNDAYMEVVGATPLWPFLESQDTSLVVTAGSGSVTLPADVWRVTSVYNATDDIPLTPIPGRASYRHWFPDPENSLGMPLFYRLRANTLEVYPWVASDTALVVDVAAPPDEITLATEPVFPEQYHRILVLGALARAYEDDESAGMAASHQARFDRLLARMMTDLLGPRDEGYPEIIDTF